MKCALSASTNRQLPPSKDANLPEIILAERVEISF
jgi:hypothetical protein